VRYLQKISKSRREIRLLSVARFFLARYMREMHGKTLRKTFEETVRGETKPKKKSRLGEMMRGGIIQFE
jgi:hypothetical protein